MNSQTAIAENNPLEDVECAAIPAHIAIIMDGNGRWAQARGLPRTEGHRQGVEAVRRTVDLLANLGVEVLTLFSFSSENWARPKSEVVFLFELLKRYIRQDLARLNDKGVRVVVIGSRDGLDAELLDLIEEAEQTTSENTSFCLQVAFNYGGQDEIVRASKRIAEAVSRGDLKPNDIDHTVFSAHLDTSGRPEPDLLIRTSGEQRLSNFLLWQCAYTEFVFLPVMWPEFDQQDLDDALSTYARRKRRFGALKECSA